MEFKIEASSQTKVLLGRIAKSLEEIAGNLKPENDVKATAPKAEEPKKMTAKEKKAHEKKIKGYADEARTKLRELAKKFGQPKAKAFLDTQFKVGSVGELLEKPDAAEQLQELANACNRLLTADDEEKDETPEDEGMFA